MKRTIHELGLALLCGLLIAEIQWVIYKEGFLETFSIVFFGLIMVGVLLRVQNMVAQRRLRPQYLRIVRQQRKPLQWSGE